MYELIQHQRLAFSGTITFTNIPQIYRDLLIVASLRDSSQEEAETIISFNGSSVGFSGRLLSGNGTSVASVTFPRFVGYNSDDVVANAFNNVQIYIPNYSASRNKSFLVESVTATNIDGTRTFQDIVAGLWSNTAAITSITLSSTANNFRVGSSATIYGINRTSAIGRPKAVGGNITYSNGYWVHTFNGSGTFATQQALEVDTLVVGGGGGTGFHIPGGGGAGGFLTNTTTVSAGSYPVLVGAGGAGSLTVSGINGAQGGPSSFNTSFALGGGYGGTRGLTPATGGNGGSGGGGGGGGSGNPLGGGLGTAGQGNNGGSGFTFADGRAAGGGGGGATAAGSNGSFGVGGNGGAGALWNGSYYAGGGGGSSANTAGTGGIGGGGNGSLFTPGVSPQNGAANTGGGAGGGEDGASGGSGIVIIRYRAD